MPKITCRKCPFTKKIFETRSGYRRHLLKLRKSRNAERVIWITQRDARNEALEALGKVTTISELKKAVMAQYTNMMIASWGTDTKKIAIAKKIRMVDFHLTKLRYEERTSNTHACPRNGVTNWGCKDADGPRGYPGFSGRINYALIVPKSFDGWFADFSNTLQQFGIHTGSGGAGNVGPKGSDKYGYDVKVFVDDFPSISAHVDEVLEVYKKIVFKQKLRDEQIHDPVFTSVLA